MRQYFTLVTQGMYMLPIHREATINSKSGNWRYLHDRLYGTSKHLFVIEPGAIMQRIQTLQRRNEVTYVFKDIHRLADHILRGRFLGKALQERHIKLEISPSQRHLWIR